MAVAEAAITLISAPVRTVDELLANVDSIEETDRTGGLVERRDPAVTVAAAQSDAVDAVAPIAAGGRRA